MAHFAKINENKEVLAVNVVDNENVTDEATGQAYLETHSNWPANTVSYTHLTLPTILRV